MLSLANLTVLDAPPHELFTAASAGGFDAVGLRIFRGSNPPFVREIVGDDRLVAELRQRSADTGVPVLDVESFVIRETVDRGRFEAGLETAALLGAHHLLSVSYDPDTGRLADSLRWLSETAAQYEVRVGVEFIPYSELRTLSEALEVVRRVGHPNIGVIVDSLHLSRSGGRPDDLAAVPPGGLSYVQLSDAGGQVPPAEGLPVEARTDRLLLGDGELWLPELLSALPADLPLSLEAPVRELAALPPVERARVAGQAARRYLEAVRREHPQHRGTGRGEQER